MRPHTSSSSRSSSEPLHEHTSAAGQSTVRARSGATMCSSARHRQPSLCARASPGNQPIHANHLHTGRSSADGGSTIFSRGLPANIDHTSSLISALSHTFHFPYSRISRYCKLVEDEKAEDARALNAALRRRHRGHEDVPDSESENEVEAYVTDRDDDDDDKLMPSA
jgi:hypothetical protein